MARVANVDFNISYDEEMKVKELTNNFFNLGEKTTNAIVSLVIQQTKILTGIENHLYARELNKLMNLEEKIKLIELLFAIAASDQEVSTIEETEIYIITTELNIERKYYILKF